jgi:hypothetical protein
VLWRLAAEGCNTVNKIYHRPVIYFMLYYSMLLAASTTGGKAARFEAVIELRVSANEIDK